MGRAPCCDKANVKKGPWSPQEDHQLKHYIQTYGIGGNWVSLPQRAGLRRCGKSCRLRWLNYLRPNIKHGQFSAEEDEIICTLFATIGSRWSIIAAQLGGRTDNDIKNHWNTKLKKKVMGMVSSNSTNNNTDTHQNASFNHEPLSNNSIVPDPTTEPLSYFSPSTNNSSIPPIFNPFDQYGLINSNNGFEQNYHDQQMMINNNNYGIMDYGGMLMNMEEEEQKKKN